jgi:hypothetical protein
MEAFAQVLIFLPVLLVSVVLHEVAHSWVALRQGDDTALRAGRLPAFALTDVALAVVRWLV